jgi:hypothetical protein
VPIAVLLIAFNAPTDSRPEGIWTRTTAQTSIFTVTTRPRTAVILDQLAAYYPNHELISSVKGYLVRSGYQVEVFLGDQVTVDLYRTLPSKDYGVIILRVHSTSTVEVSQSRTVSGAPVFLLTGELHNYVSHSYDQLMSYVRPVKIDVGTFFGIGPDFVSKRMEGTFPSSLIILAGCESLRNKDLARALIARGASNVIGWSDSVELEHNDKAIVSLTKALFQRRLPITVATQSTMNEIGKDPTFQSTLLSYP